MGIICFIKNVDYEQVKIKIDMGKDVFQSNVMENGLFLSGDKGVYYFFIEFLVSIYCFYQGDGGFDWSVFRDIEGVENVGEDRGIVVDVGDVDFYCSYCCVSVI